MLEKFVHKPLEGLPLSSCLCRTARIVDNLNKDYFVFRLTESPVVILKFDYSTWYNNLRVGCFIYLFIFYFPSICKHWPSGSISYIFTILCHELGICHNVCGFPNILDSVCFCECFVCYLLWYCVTCFDFLLIVIVSCGWLMIRGFLIICMTFLKVIVYLLLVVAFALLDKLFQQWFVLWAYCQTQYWICLCFIL